MEKFNNRKEKGSIWIHEKERGLCSASGRAAFCSDIGCQDRTERGHHEVPGNDNRSHPVSVVAARDRGRTRSLISG